MRPQGLRGTALVVVWLGAGAPPAPGDVAARSNTTSTAPHPVGTEVCRSCHPVEADHWRATVHARHFSHPRSARERLGCEACHGPGSRHAAEPGRAGGILRFTRESESTIEEQNGACLSCHAGGRRMHWLGSTHERHDLACGDCHNPMARLSSTGLATRPTTSETCLTCHPQQRTEFRKRSHMPLHEGKIACSDCHNPHGSYTQALLDGDSVNHVCTSCHAEKRGPFLWEHAPVVESCLNCHRPHGSNHRALLVSSPPYLCQQCHSQLLGFGHPNDLLTAGNLIGGARPDERILNRGCVNCHVQIHGSNHPSGIRFHR